LLPFLKASTALSPAPEKEEELRQNRERIQHFLINQTPGSYQSIETAYGILYEDANDFLNIPQSNDSSSAGAL
jgi:hypothetical protein